MTYPQALEYLDSFIDHEKDRSFEYPEAFKLDRMRALAKEFGNPQNFYESVIIAGSKGKGSTAAFLSHILRMEDYRVGLYTSPHLEDLRERIQVNGIPISEARLVEFMGRLKKVMDDHSWKKDPPTYFEVLTCLAFLHFKEMKVHAAVLEVGLGGLYDSTNIAPAKVAGIAPVSLEHTDKLGKTVSKIAVQKAGVIKQRQIVVSAPQLPEAEDVIVQACERNDAELARVGKEIRVSERGHDARSQHIDVRTPWGGFFDLEMSLLGAHQAQNAAVAIGLAKALEKRARLPVDESAVRQGIAATRWPGRLERVSERPDILLDGAHNVESVQRMLEALKRHFHWTRLVVVFASSADKDAQGMLALLFPEAAAVILTQFEGPRATPVGVLAEKTPPGAAFERIERSSEALERARRLTGVDDMVLVTGSLYLVAEVRKALRNP